MEQKRLGIPREVPVAVQQWQGLIAINYAARARGITRHMRVQEAMARCPELQCVHVQTIGAPWAAPCKPSLEEIWAGAMNRVAHGAGGTEEDTKDRAKQKACLERYRRACWEILAVLHKEAPQVPLSLTWCFKGSQQGQGANGCHDGAAT